MFVDFVSLLCITFFFNLVCSDVSLHDLLGRRYGYTKETYESYCSVVLSYRVLMASIDLEVSRNFPSLAVSETVDVILLLSGSSRLSFRK